MTRPKSLSRLASWLLLLIAMLLVGTPAAADEPVRAIGPGARDLIDAPPGELMLRAPPIPRDYVVVRRGSLEISYPSSIESQVQATLGAVDHDARAVAEQLGLTEIPSLDVRLVPSPDAMRRLAPAEAPPPAYAVGVAYPSIGLALVSASAPASWEASDMRRVLRHELSHLLLGAATQHAAIPRWLSEGIAVHQAGEHNYERFKALAFASFTGGLVPLRRLDGSFSEGPEQVNVAYAESADFVSYLMRSEGDARFAVFIAHLREGNGLDDAIRQTYRSTLTQLEYEWRHDVSIRFLTAPLWAGTGFLWFGAIVLLVIAFFRRRSKSKATLSRWAIEESTPLEAFNVAVVTPGARAFTQIASEPPEAPIAETPSPEMLLERARTSDLPETGPASDPTVRSVSEPAPTPSHRSREFENEDSMPRITLDGERFTLH